MPLVSAWQSPVFAARLVVCRAHLCPASTTPQEGRTGVARGRALLAWDKKKKKKNKEKVRKKMDARACDWGRRLLPPLWMRLHTRADGAHERGVGWPPWG